jgi:hypothetical protein
MDTKSNDNRRLIIQKIRNGKGKTNTYKKTIAEITSKEVRAIASKSKI